MKTEHEKLESIAQALDAQARDYRKAREQSLSEGATALASVQDSWLGAYERAAAIIRYQIECEATTPPASWGQPEWRDSLGANSAERPAGF